jgi:hypothetical protein
MQKHFCINFCIIYVIDCTFYCYIKFPRFFFYWYQFFVFWKGKVLIFNSLKQIMRILIKTCKWETVEKHVTTRSLYKTIINKRRIEETLYSVKGKLIFCTIDCYSFYFLVWIFQKNEIRYDLFETMHIVIILKVHKPEECMLIGTKQRLVKCRKICKHVTTRSLYKTIDFYNGVSLTKENIPYEKRIVKCYLDDKDKKTIKSTINNIDYTFYNLCYWLHFLLSFYFYRQDNILQFAFHKEYFVVNETPVYWFFFNKFRSANPIHNIQIWK